MLAAVLAGKEANRYEGSIVGTGLKVSGVDLFSAGEIEGNGDSKSIIVHNEFDGVYKKIIIREDRISGIVLYGDTTDSSRMFRMLVGKESVAGMSGNDILGLSGNGENTNSAAAMSDEEIVCGCNGVTKGTIANEIKASELSTVDEVGGCTKAGRSCGRCKPLISEILAAELGDSYDTGMKKQPICGCTDYSRDEVVEEISKLGLTSVREVMQVLGWKQEEGCNKCRPAVNYYLGMMLKESYSDDRDSRLVNEKQHANIQKDGTYSVVPRMYGGVTSAADLKKIAEVAEKYQVPLVKLTGGQRIGLFGLKREELPAVWEDLGMLSGYAYGKTLRTVKTCVGAAYCRYGTQDSMGLGIELEQKFERLDTPHKVKMGVSGCPRNCAEAGIKDFGIVGIDGGWEIYVAGNGGTDLRAADLLETVKTKEEAIELIGAFLQYYRETAVYLERTSKWVERVGLDHVREVLADADVRKALNARLDQTLERYSDPWQEAIDSKEIKEKYYSRQAGRKELAGAKR